MTNFSASIHNDVYEIHTWNYSLAEWTFPVCGSYICDRIWEMCMVHTSDYVHLEINKNYGMAYRFETFRSDNRIVALQSLKVSYILYQRLYDSGCVNYARFPKSGHIYWSIYSERNMEEGHGLMIILHESRVILMKASVIVAGY